MLTTFFLFLLVFCLGGFAAWVVITAANNKNRYHE